MPVFKKDRPATPPADGAGEAIPGYRDLHRVGRGGFSVVYRAHQEQLDRVVALKVLSVEFIDTQVRRRFLREVQLTSRLTGHPNVVTVLDSGMTGGGRPYIAMEYFERGSLRDRLAAEGALPVPDALRVGVKIAGALGTAHQEGMLHRDVKPQNVLVSRYGEPALADFGTARLTAAMDVSARTEALTPYHAAPEVLQGTTPAPACDIYSLGSTLYQLLANRPPYQPDDGGIAALLLRVLQQDPPPITRADLPPSLAAAIRRAMARDPAARFPDAWSFAQALQRIQLELGLPMTELPNAPSLPADQHPTAAAWSPQAGGESPTGAPETPESPAGPPVIAPDPGWQRTPEDTGFTTTSERTTIPVPPAVEEPTPPRRRWPLVVGIVVVAAALVAAPLLWSGLSGTSPSPSPRARTTGQVSAPVGVPTGNGAPVGPSASAAEAAARPTHVTVEDGGSSAVLRWTLAPGTDRYNVAVAQAPNPQQQDTYLGPGTRSYTVTGLNPSTGYCFQVGVILTLGVGQQGTVAWSTPACIRGAIPNQ